MPVRISYRRFMKVTAIIYTYLIAALLGMTLGLISPDGSFAEEVEFDTGVIKVISGRDNGGFIDEVYLDRNKDGIYSDNELIVLRPDDSPGLLVLYTELRKGDSREGVAVGPGVQASVKVKEASVKNLGAVIKGVLDFGKHGKSPFEVSVRGRKKSAVLIVDFNFEPLRSSNDLLLRQAALRIYGEFDKREPKGPMRSMSTGPFRTTPRPESTFQPMVWQYGGHLVESPWYWRNWVSWSRGTGPQTTREGHTPPKDLTFYMYDNFHGIRAILKEPASVSPVELSGSGFPSFLSINAWTPRVGGMDMRGDLPSSFYMKEAAIHFFSTDIEKLARRKHQYKKKLNEVLENSKKEILSIAEPVVSNLIDRRISDGLYAERSRTIAKLKDRGWAANVSSTDTAFSSVMKSSDLPYGKGWFKVVLDIPDGVAGKNVLAKGGVPFPKGELASVKHLRLIDHNGNEVAMQADRLAMWPDGSVKWALLTAFVEISKDKTPAFRVEYGPDIVRKVVIPEKIEIQQSSKGMQVSNGAIRFTLDRNGSGIFDMLWFDRNGDDHYSENEKVFDKEGDVRRNRMDLVAIEKSYDYGPYMYHVHSSESEKSSARVEGIEIERQGPLVAHILVKGRYHYKKLGRKRDKHYENKGNEFWIRFTVYAGQSYIEIKHSYVFEGNPDLEMIQNMSLSAAPNLGSNRIFTAAMDNKVHELGMQSPQSSAGIYQGNPYSSELWISGESEGIEEINNVALKGNGWADISDDKWGITFGVRHMQEMYAKGLSMEKGSINISLWPERARYLDTRRYARQFTTGEAMSFGQGAAQGVSRSHDAFFYFHTGGVKEAKSGAVARYLLKTVFIKAYPRWYTKTEAAGSFAPYEEKNNQEMENILQDGLEYFLYNQRLWAWYGIYDYGDLQQKPLWGGAGWDKLNGRWGWVNNESLVDMWIYESFLRTGKREYLDAALALSRHTMEVDLINSDNYKGNKHVKMHGHRHNVNHWGDGYVGIRVAAPQGFRLGYFLTGDLRIYDQLKMSMEAHWDSVYGSDRQHATGLGLLIFFWEATGDDVYKKALDSYLDYQMAHFRKFGHIHNGTWKFRKDQGRVPDEKRLSAPPLDFFFQNFGSAYSLMELADLTGRSDIVEALVQYARDTAGSFSRSWESRYCHYRLMAFAYRHTGDKTFLEYAIDHVEKLQVFADRSTWNYRPAIESLSNKLSMLAWTGQGLPYLMKAVELRRDYPVASFDAPKIIKMPGGKNMAPLHLDGSSSKAMDGTIQSYQWRAGEKILSSKPADTFEFAPGLHQIELWVTDTGGRRSKFEKKVAVWEPGVITRLCFRKAEKRGFFRAWKYSDELGYGFLPGTEILGTAEPRRYGGMGCSEVRISGTVHVKTGPGVFTVEMGGKEFWTEKMGTISIQGKPLDIKVKKESNKKIEWGYTGEAKVGEDGLLKIDFIKGPNGEPVVVAYIIVKKI
jgi:hypothetical protein